MIKFLRIIGLLLIIFASTYFLIYYFHLSRHILIKENEILTKNILLNTGTLELEKNSTLAGNVEIKEGSITLKEGAKIMGTIKLTEGEIVTDKNNEISQDIYLKEGALNLKESNIIKGNIFVEQGNIIIGKTSILEKNLNLKKGNLRLEENTEIKGGVEVRGVEIEKHSSAIFGGKKPKVYKVYDWPEALQYFDILPEEHKNQVGFIILTKEKNGLIRDEKITEGNQYFEVIYDYKEGNLIKIDLIDPKVMSAFFKKAKIFFKSLPEYRMIYFDVGATTENYANNPEFADIYLPAYGSGTLILHEMGHVMDFKDDFSDFHIPKFPWTKEDAVSSYGATHPGEDFAEAYRLYVLNPEKFLKLIQENPERQKKWDYLKEWVFNK